MGNDIVCQMLEIYTVWIKMFDGVVKDLTDVSYVPQIKKNIISVGVVESKGLKVTVENGILKILPVVKHSFISILLALVAQYDYELD